MLCNIDDSKVLRAYVITKKLEDVGILKHKTKVPILKIPAVVFLYMLGRMEE